MPITDYIENITLIEFEKRGQILCDLELYTY